MRDVELKERSSRSLLANVLDIDDDIRAQQNQQCPHQSKMSNSTSSNHCSRQKLENYTFNNTHAFVENHIGSHIGNHHQDTCDSNCNKPIYKDILKELTYLTDKIKRDEDFQDRCTDWKFAALVIDRLCLWLFTTFTIVSTCAILFSAPHVFS